MKGQHIYCSNSRVSWSSWTGGCAKIDLADLSGFVFDRKRASHRATRLRSVATSSLSQRIHYRANRIVISRACDFFDLFRVFCISNQPYFKPPDKAVILSEALRRSIANRRLYGAESKGPGDACWQMLLEAFRPQITPKLVVRRDWYFGKTELAKDRM